MSTHDDRQNQIATAERARRLVRSMVRRMAVEDGAHIVTRPLRPGSDIEISDVEPLAGFRAAHDLELGAGNVAHSYVRAAREGGATWHEIGMAMRTKLRKDAAYAGYSPAELAYRYAIQPIATDDPSYELTFNWKCETCHGYVRDDGPYSSPANSERGHANGCARFAEAQADWQADWEATD